MSGIVDNIVQKYNYVFHELADPRTAEWWGVSNPLIILSILSSYLYFCKYLGPRIMENRKPFELKNVIMLYNLFQVCFSIFLAYESHYGGYSFLLALAPVERSKNVKDWHYISKLLIHCQIIGNTRQGYNHSITLTTITKGVIGELEGAVYIFHREYSLSCDPIDYSRKPRALRIAAGGWFYFIAKISELLDTVMFVLRKKYNQVSFLHVYHHTLMSFFVWYGLKYYPGGHSILMGFLNSIVHIIMYTYYLISGFGPQYQKYLWWKKHVTLIQLIQFVIVFFHNLTPFFYNCDYPKHLNLLSCVNALAFMYMFGNFYIRSYQKQSKSKAALETKKVPSLTTKVNKCDNRKKLSEKSR